MVSSIRLENIRDGIEDLELFAKLGVDSKAHGQPLSTGADLITTAVSNGTNFTLDGAVLERARRAAAARAEQRGAGDA